MKDGILLAFKCAALAAVVFMCVALGLLFLQARDVTAELPELTRSEMTLTRQFLDQRLNAISGEVQVLYGKLSSDVRFVATAADERLGSVEHGVLDVVDRQLTQTNSSVDKVATAYAGIPAHVAAQLEPYTNCDANELCWQGQVSDVMLAARNASRDVSRTLFTVNQAVPPIAASVETGAAAFKTGFPRMVVSAGNTAANIDRLTKPRWYDRLIGYSLNGLLMYRQLNPGTNVGVAATQAASSQK